MKEVYKIVEPCIDGYRFLFHGLNRDKKLPFDQWIKADKKLVKDGSNGRLYISGFHCFKTENDADNYLRKFKLPTRTIIKCLAKGLRQKPTNSNVYLADAIFIPSGDEINRNFMSIL